MFGLALRDDFAKAVEAAVAKTLSAGVAVSSIEHGRATETRPDGQTRDIDETVAWSPHAWRENSRARARDAQVLGRRGTEWVR